RSIDSMIAIAMIFCTLVIFAAFRLNTHLVRKGEVALLKSLGATQRHIVRIKIAEVLALIIVSIIFVMIFSPFSITNILRIGVLDYNVWAYTFPVSIIASANWISFLSVGMFLLIPSILLIVALSTRRDDESIADIMAEIEIARENAFSGERV
ncbi:MAG: FtsX-like permease family protein, partial [Candidatus Thorarchaeota archaeon]